MQNKFPISGIILAGGKNSRFNGQKKTFLSVGTESIFNRIYSVMNIFFDDLLVVTRSPEFFLKWDINIVNDVYTQHSPLNGIYSALFFARHPQIFVTACDTPFISARLIEYMCSSYDPKCDVYMPSTKKGDEPLCAIYSRRCLNRFKSRLNSERCKIIKCFNGLNVCTIDDNTLRSKDIQRHSFFNINTFEDLSCANRLINELKSKEDKNETYHLRQKQNEEVYTSNIGKYKK